MVVSIFLCGVKVYFLFLREIPNGCGRPKIPVSCPAILADERALTWSTFGRPLWTAVDDCQHACSSVFVEQSDATPQPPMAFVLG